MRLSRTALGASVLALTLLASVPAGALCGYCAPPMLPNGFGGCTAPTPPVVAPTPAPVVQPPPPAAPVVVVEPPAPTPAVTSQPPVVEAPPPAPAAVTTAEPPAPAPTTVAYEPPPQPAFTPKAFSTDTASTNPGFAGVGEGIMSDGRDGGGARIASKGFAGVSASQWCQRDGRSKANVDACIKAAAH